MRKILTFFFTCFWVLNCTLVFAQQRALINDDVVNMIKAGLTESTIILSIEKSATKFDTSPQNLIELKKQGVAPKILEAMLNAQSREKDAPNGTNQTSAPKVNSANQGFPPGSQTGNTMGENVWMIQNSKRIPLQMTLPESKGDASGALIPVVGMFKKAKVKQTLKGERSELRISTASPQFEVRMTSAEIKPTDFYKIVRFQVKSGNREMEIARGGIFGSSTGVNDKSIIPIKFEESKSDGGYGKIYKIVLLGSLEPGEYAIYTPTGSYYDFGVDQK